MAIPNTRQMPTISQSSTYSPPPVHLRHVTAPTRGAPATWIEMMETRYTKWANIGSDTRDGYVMNEKGPYFEEMPA